MRVAWAGELQKSPNDHPPYGDIACQAQITEGLGKFKGKIVATVEGVITAP